MVDDRRHFMSSAVAVAIALTLGTHATNSFAADGYELIDPQQNTSSDDSVEIMEFFWLGCPHCYAFESFMSTWENNMPENVNLVREAPPLNPSWEEHSRGFYAAQLMGDEHAFVTAMFSAIHEKGQPMRKPSDIADLAQDIGLDREKFLSLTTSFTVQTKLNRSIQLAKSAGITGVPSIVVNGKYRTGARLAGGNAGIIDVINKTVAIEKRAMALN